MERPPEAVIRSRWSASIRNQPRINLSRKARNTRATTILRYTETADETEESEEPRALQRLSMLNEPGCS